MLSFSDQSSGLPARSMLTKTGHIPDAQIVYKEQNNIRLGGGGVGLQAPQHKEESLKAHSRAHLSSEIYTSPLMGELAGKRLNSFS